MSNYRFIRISEGFGVGVVIAPADAKLGDQGATFHEINFGLQGPHEKGVFVPAAVAHVEFLGSGHADGMGWEQLPEEAFPDLAAAKAWIETKYTAYWKAHAETHPPLSPEGTLALLERASQGDPEDLEMIAAVRRHISHQKGQA